MEFLSDSSFAPPGGSVTLNWKVSIRLRKARSPACRAARPGPSMPPRWQGPNLDHDARDSDDRRLCSGRFRRCGGGDLVNVASRALQIQISRYPATLGIIRSILHRRAGQGSGVDVSRPITDDMVPRLIDQIFAQFKIYYPDVDFYLGGRTIRSTLRASCSSTERTKIVLFGGLVRRSCLYYEGLCFIVAQCVARLSGGLPPAPHRA